MEVSDEHADLYYVSKSDSVGTMVFVPTCRPLKRALIFLGDVYPVLKHGAISPRRLRRGNDRGIG